MTATTKKAPDLLPDEQAQPGTVMVLEECSSEHEGATFVLGVFRTAQQAHRELLYLLAGDNNEPVTFEAHEAGDAPGWRAPAVRWWESVPEGWRIVEYEVGRITRVAASMYGVGDSER